MHKPVSIREHTRAVIHREATILRFWQPLLRKPPQSANHVHALVVLERETCEGRLTGAVKACIEAPEPLEIYSRLMWELQLAGETPDQAILCISPGTSPERKRAGIAAHDWFTREAALLETA